VVDGELDLAGHRLLVLHTLAGALHREQLCALIVIDKVPCFELVAFALEEGLALGLEV